MLATIGKLAAKSILNMLMSLATEKFFKEIFIMLAEMAVKSTETKYDDQLVEKIKEALEMGE